MSSTESEYIAQALTTQDAIWLSLLLEELSMTDQDQNQMLKKPITIYGDNKGAIALSKNPEFHANTKHIEMRYHFLRKEVMLGKVEFRFVVSAEQIADGFTKPLAATKFRQFVESLGLHEMK